MTPTPQPTDLFDGASAPAYFATALIIIGLASVFVWAILRAARYEAPSSLIVALSLLTFLALTGAIVADSTELTTLAATGIGALAGAVSAQFTDKRRSEDDDGDADR